MCKWMVRIIRASKNLSTGIITGYEKRESNREEEPNAYRISKGLILGAKE